MSGIGGQRGLRGRGRWLALAAVALGGLVLPAAYAGDETGTNLGTEKGLNYRVNLVEDYVGTAPLDSFVACRDGDRPIAGGVDVELPDGQARIGGTYPAQEGGVREWRSVGQNLLGGDMDMSFFAVCRKVEPSLTRFPSAIRTFASGEMKSLKAACPNGFEVTGGGVRGPNPSIMGSVPYDAKDHDHKPDDGWKVTAVNSQSGIEEELQAFASCRRAGDWDLSYVKEKLTIGTDATGEATEICTHGVVTGGGASITGENGLTRMLETYPADFGDSDTTPADGWTSSLRNGSASATDGVAHAVCRN